MDLTVALRETFGFDAFRPGQEDAVESLCHGTFDHMTARQVLARVDELIQGWCLRSTGAAYPKLEAA